MKTRKQALKNIMYILRKKYPQLLRIFWLKQNDFEVKVINKPYVDSFLKAYNILTSIPVKS